MMFVVIVLGVAVVVLAATLHTIKASKGNRLYWRFMGYKAIDEAVSRAFATYGERNIMQLRVVMWMKVEKGVVEETIFSTVGRP